MYMKSYEYGKSSHTLIDTIQVQYICLNQKIIYYLYPFARRRPSSLKRGIWPVRLVKTLIFYIDNRFILLMKIKIQPLYANRLSICAVGSPWTIVFLTEAARDLTIEH